MAWTKRDVISMAFEEIAIANGGFQADNDMYQSALKRLNLMIAGWQKLGIAPNYVIPTTPETNSDLTSDAVLTNDELDTAYMMLAVRIAPSYGKQLDPLFKSMADNKFSLLRNRVAVTIPDRVIPGSVPFGAGNKPWIYGQQFTADDTTGTTP